jgi:hypothetical protein
MKETTREKTIDIVGIIMIVSVAAIILGGVFYGTYLDAQADKQFRLELKLDIGDIVDLKIGGKGQVIARKHMRSDTPYLIRIRTNDGFDEQWLSKLEIEYEVKQ